MDETYRIPDNTGWYEYTKRSQSGNYRTMGWWDGKELRNRRGGPYLIDVSQCSDFVPIGRLTDLRRALHQIRICATQGPQYLPEIIEIAQEALRGEAV